jgi:hypothetical protein
MLKILNQPYPFPERENLRALVHCLLEGFFIGVFLIVFQPFGIEQWQHPNKNLFLWGYGLMTALGGITLRLGLIRLFPNYYEEEKWTVGREILMILTILILISSYNYLYSNWVFGWRFSFENFLWMFSAVCIIGVFPTTVGVMLNYIYKLKKYSRSIEVHHHAPLAENRKTSENQSIKFIAENEKDTFEVETQALLFIESADNYSTIHYTKDGRVMKEMIRGSLSRMEGFIDSPDIVRCHRSYIVNLEKVEKVSGNAQGYKLHLTQPELLVPVARKYSEIVEKLK